MRDKVLAFLLRSWVIGMVVVIVYFMLHLQHFFIGLVLGIINTFFTERFIDAIINGNKTTEMTHKKLLLSVMKNITISVLIAFVIRGIDFALLSNDIVDIPIEPFRFMFYYQLIYYGYLLVYHKIIRRKKNVNND